MEAIEIVSNSSETQELVYEIEKGGVDPILVRSGIGGTYCFKNSRGESIAIVKPADEEPYAPNNPKGCVGRALGLPGLKGSVVGQGVYREVAAYLLDHDHFANVPLTAMIKITHSVFNVNEGGGDKNISKLASIQQFIPHDCDASEHGTSSFPTADVHRVGILDIRIFNTDRHAGNLLVKKLNDDGVQRFELIPIDHGLCLPEDLEDPYFEWIHWPQASIPFTEEELKYIKDLDPYKDANMLESELPMIKKTCHHVLIMSTIFLKEAAAHGLSLSEIGEMMSRKFRHGKEEPSALELLCMDARRLVDEGKERGKVPWSVLDSFMVCNLKTMEGHGVNSSLNKQLPASARFVNLADMKEEEEWGVFLDKFQELLHPALKCRA
ncbi:hypothetical protein L1987_00447 [Smallanthus sonchifolius]|uniref:Uncharacterized protein n=1 Tax=Smallanthus sonchifolius TaxID=185202 RepID=A0ACB9K2J5_9ASTR|nr:hypothetical protein L1987_00447 [Smallanthus sonchifolius]